MARPPRVRVVVDGPALRQFARQMPVVRDGVQTVAEDIADTARRLVPVRTGALRDSITTERPLRKGEEGDTVRVGARLFYAQFVELGTRDTPPRPFLRPAAAQYRQARGKHYAGVTRKRARTGRTGSA